ncbi:MAG: hypothetical protein DI629_13300 [Mesorhizobium amorphae]|nr:MAG: hypothetical protein DI629_13300 [Mesorhizobium amorphae]
MFLVLGALGTLLAALLVVPPLLRRAERLERTRLTRSLPLSLDELASEKDALRAEWAVTARKLELDAKAARHEATERMLARDRMREELRQTIVRLEDRQTRVEHLETEVSDLSERLSAAEQRVARLEEEASSREAAREAGESELRVMSERHTAARETLGARDKEIERLGGEVGNQRGTIRDADRRMAEMAGEILAAREQAAADKRRVEENADRTDIMRSELFDAREALEHRMRETDRLRRELDSRNTEIERLSAQLVETRAGRAGVELELASMNGRLARLFPRGGTGDPQSQLAAAAAERDRLEARLAVLQRENKELRDGDKGAGGGEVLREEMMRLAAEMAAVTARLEGPGGAIDQMLSDNEEEGANGGPSLAQRIRALRDQLRAAPEK